MSALSASEMDVMRKLQKGQGVSTEAACVPGVSDKEAGAIRALFRALNTPGRGVPVAALARFAGDVRKPLVIDFEAARRIGVPVLVLKEEALENPLWRRLSARERDVVRLIADGKRNAEIAGALRISLSTVKDHVHNALTKTGLSSRAALAALVR